MSDKIMDIMSFWIDIAGEDMLSVKINKRIPVP